MFPDHRTTPVFDRRLPRPDRRPPQAAEIRLRVRRLSERLGD